MLLHAPHGTDTHLAQFYGVIDLRPGQLFEAKFSGSAGSSVID